jgi:hypothetical protein
MSRLSTTASPSLLLSALLLAGLTGGVGAQERGANNRAEAPARIRGQVLDLVSALPIPGVAIRLTPAGSSEPITRVSDEDGRFSFPELVSGTYVVELTHIAFGTARESLRVDQGADIDVVAELAPAAIPLPPVVVSTSRRSRLDTSGFYDRRRTRSGTFITREQVENRPAMYLSDVLRMVPSLRLTSLPGGQGSAITGRGGCFPTYFLDGVRLLESASLDGFVLPDHLEGVEVYTAATAPAEYSSGRCGAIVIWTRQPGGGDGSPLSWRRVIAGGAALLAILFLSR